MAKTTSQAEYFRSSKLLSHWAVQWVRSNLFANAVDTLITLVLIVGAFLGIWGVVRWAVLDAVGFTGSAEQCRSAKGACWAVVGNNFGLFLFGTYPFEERWRGGAAMLLILASFGSLFLPAMRRWPIVISGYLLSLLAVLVLLLGSRSAGLSPVDVDVVGGFMLTLFICWVALPAALPLAVLLALARQSRLPALHGLSSCYIEMVRGLPLVVVLFLSSVIFPLFMESGANMPKVFRAALAIQLFAAAYLAEVIRGGLQAIPRGQYEAAEAIGMKYWQIHWKIIFPQVSPIIVRPLSGMYITFFKNTSLISVIGLFELTGITTIVITRPEWTIFSIETYLVVGCVYLFCCWIISRLASTLEQTPSARNPRIPTN